MIGKVFIGRTEIGWSAGKCSSRDLHINAGLPLTSALHEPHLAALQFQRTARSGAWWAWIQWIASSTTIGPIGAYRPCPPRVAAEQRTTASRPVPVIASPTAFAARDRL
jgi:hypothetical protein